MSSGPQDHMVAPGSSLQTGTPSPASPESAGAAAQAAPMGEINPSDFTPEQWQAYQQAYQQAMDAQQLYAQAQQAYIQAEQVGQVEIAQQAYQQAIDAQQLYNQAHQVYLSIIEQLQQKAPGPSASPQNPEFSGISGPSPTSPSGSQPSSAPFDDQPKPTSAMPGLVADLAAQMRAEHYAQPTGAMPGMQAPAGMNFSPAPRASSPPPSSPVAPPVASPASYDQPKPTAAMPGLVADLAAQMRAEVAAQGSLPPSQPAHQAAMNPGLSPNLPPQGPQQPMPTGPMPGMSPAGHPPQGPQQPMPTGPMPGMSPAGSLPQRPQQPMPTGPMPGMSPAGYPPQGQQPSTPGMPPQGYPQPGQPGMMPGGYPPQAMPAGMMPGGYPPQAMPAGMMPGGYPPQAMPAGMMPGGYPPQAPMQGAYPGYPMQPMHPGMAQAPQPIGMPAAPAPRLPSVEPLLNENDPDWGDELPTPEEGEGKGGKFFWGFVVVMLLLGAAYIAYESYRPRPQTNRLPDSSLQGTKKVESNKPLTEEEKEKIRRQLSGVDNEAPSKFIRLVPLPKNGTWSSVSVAGLSECRSLYLGEGNDLYAAEGDVPKDAPDYIKFTERDAPFDLRPLPFPSRLIDWQLSEGPQGTFLLIRYRASGPIWLAIVPLVGDPLEAVAPKKKKGKKGKKKPKKEEEDDGPSCGESKLPSYLALEDILLLGMGDCDVAAKALGAKSSTCASDLLIPEKGSLAFFPSGEKNEAKGQVLIENKLYTPAKKGFTSAAAPAQVLQRLQHSSVPTPEVGKDRWITLDKTSGQLWAFDSSLAPEELNAKIVETPLDVIRLSLRESTLVVVYPNKIVKFTLNGPALEDKKEFPLGPNVAVHHASWGRSGQNLLLLTKKNKLYQFSEVP